MEPNLFLSTWKSLLPCSPKSHHNFEYSLPIIDTAHFNISYAILIFKIPRYILMMIFKYSVKEKAKFIPPGPELDFLKPLEEATENTHD